MKELLLAGCELFADNKDLIHKVFQWDYDIMSVAGSIIFTGAGQVADEEKLKECRKILKKNAGSLSVFRNSMEIPVVCKMILSEDPELYLMKITEIYKKLHKGRILDSNYLALAAACIHDGQMDDQVDQIIEKTKTLMKRIEKEHPFLTSDEDTSTAALLAMTHKSVDEIIYETEECFKIMNVKFPGHKNAIQSLSHVLTVEEGDLLQKCEKVSGIYDALKRKKLKFGLESELAALGALVNVKATPEEIADDIFDAAEYLKKRKGFGDWDMGKQTRLLFAALMVAQASAKYDPDTTALGSTIALVIAEEITFMLIMASCAATSSSSVH